MNKKLLSLALAGAVVAGGVGITTNTASAAEQTQAQVQTINEKSERIIQNMYIDPTIGSKRVLVGCGGNNKQVKVKLVHTYKMSNSVMTKTDTFYGADPTPDVGGNTHIAINVNSAVKKGDKFTLTLTASSGTKTMTLTV